MIGGDTTVCERDRRRRDSTRGRGPNDSRPRRQMVREGRISAAQMDPAERRRWRDGDETEREKRIGKTERDGLFRNGEME